MLKKQLLLAICGLLALQAAAQSVFNDIPESAIPQKIERRSALQRYRTVKLDAAALQTAGAIRRAALDRSAAHGDIPVARRQCCTVPAHRSLRYGSGFAASLPEYP